MRTQSPVSMLTCPGSVHVAVLVAFSKRTPSRASASSVGEVGRGQPYAETLRARSVSIETRTTFNGGAGVACGVRIERLGEDDRPAVLRRVRGRAVEAQADRPSRERRGAETRSSCQRASSGPSARCQIVSLPPSCSTRTCARIAVAASRASMPVANARIASRGTTKGAVVTSCCHAPSAGRSVTVVRRVSFSFGSSGIRISSRVLRRRCAAERFDAIVEDDGADHVGATPHADERRDRHHEVPALGVGLGPALHLDARRGRDDAAGLAADRRIRAARDT